MRRVATVNPDGSGSFDVPPSDVTGQPAWSADGTLLAFARMTPPDGSAPGIFTSRADGSDLRRVTLAKPVGAGGAHFHFNPAWSPDGSRILYEDFLDPPDGLAVIPAFTSIRVVDVVGGADAVFVSPTSSGRHVRFPAWSPDGAHISFTTADGSNTGGDELWTIEPTGANRRQVTATESPKGRSDWSPDSSTLIFQNGTVEFAEIAAIASTATNGVPSFLTNNDHFDGCPDVLARRQPHRLRRVPTTTAGCRRGLHDGGERQRARGSGQQHAAGNHQRRVVAAALAPASARPAAAAGHPTSDGVGADAAARPRSQFDRRRADRHRLQLPREHRRAPRVGARERRGGRTFGR